MIQFLVGLHGKPGAASLIGPSVILKKDKTQQVTLKGIQTRLSRDYYYYYYYYFYIYIYRYQKIIYFG
jgi:hypothetical protein